MRRGRHVLVLLVTCAVACAGSTPPSFLTDRNGGPTTARALRGRPFHQAARNLDNAGLARFARGAEVFDDPTGCLSCHVDGTERSSRTDLAPGHIVRIGLDDGNGGLAADPNFGLQIDPDRVAVSWRTVEGAFPDGQAYTLRRPVLTVDSELARRLDPDVVISVRIPPPLLGLGLLEAVHLPRGAARFGWKAEEPSVASQTRRALIADLDIDPSSLDPGDLADLIYYTRTIAVPVARGTDTEPVRRGASVFESFGCASCHSPTLVADASEIAALDNATFHPFTDLRTHDLGDGLAETHLDGTPSANATARRWRTPPLWGLGRRTEVQGTAGFLHDGRARTIEEAILWHGGEASSARRRYLHASRSTRQDLLAFLGSL
jgi:CxxC motif-containing protein (DUF1111 family)